jgi:uncharacterized protein (DUF58 family)
MIPPKLLILAFILGLAAFVALLRRAGTEGKAVLVFAALALTAFLRLKFYLLLFTALALFMFVFVALLWAWMASLRLTVSRESKDEALVDENLPVRYKVKTRSFLPLYHVRIWDFAYRSHYARSAGGAILGGKAQRLFSIWNARRAAFDSGMSGSRAIKGDIRPVKLWQEPVEFEEPGYVGFLRVGDSKEPVEGLQHIVPKVRGMLNFGPIGVEGGDPFGIFTFIRWLRTSDQCLILPTWVKLKALPGVMARTGSRQHERLTSKEGQSHELLGVRTYSEGDSLRRVHWPLTAKHDELIVRQFERQVEEEMVITLDADLEADVGDGAENAFEYLITLASSLVHSASEMGRPWALVIVGTKVEEFNHRDKESLLGVQYALAKLAAERTSPIEQYIQEIQARHPSSGFALLTARTDPGPVAALSAASQSRVGHDPVQSIIIRVDPGSFSAGIDDNIKAMKRRKSVAHAQMGSPVSPISEIVISRGDNLAELFLSRALV